MVTQDTPGDRALARKAGNAIAIIANAISEGMTGVLKRLGVALRDSAGMPFLDALRKQAVELVPPERLDAPET